MGGFLRWAAGNLAHFVAGWVAIATTVFAAVGFDRHDVVPHSPVKVLFVPIALALLLFAAAFTAFVTLLLLLPVIAVWLAIYLPALWWLGSHVDRRTGRVAAIVFSALPLVFVHGDDRPTTYSVVALGALYGATVRLPV